MKKVGHVFVAIRNSVGYRILMDAILVILGAAVVIYDTNKKRDAKKVNYHNFTTNSEE